MLLQGAMSNNNHFFEPSVDIENMAADNEDIGAPFTPPGGTFPNFSSPSSLPMPRVTSSNSLFGEYIMSSTRRSNDDEETTTPPSYSNTPMTLSPPELKQEAPLIFQTGDDSIHSNYSIKLRGRPPLAPQPQLNISQVRQAGIVPAIAAYHHKREKSTGDYSFLSALTDDPDPSDSDGEFPIRLTDEKPCRRDRKRSVSWDQTWEGSHESNTQNILQPILADDLPSLHMEPDLREHVEASSVIPMIALQSLQEFPTKTSPWEKFSLADFVSPIESEAETAILRALEDHQHEHAMAHEIILPNVPDDAAHSFAHIAAMNVDEPLSFQSKDAVVEEEKKKNGHSDIHDLSRRTNSTSSMYNTTKTSKGAIVESKLSPSPSRTQKSDSGSKGSELCESKSSKPRHLRAMSRHTIASRNEHTSLESTLFGLTTAMREIHSTGNEPKSLPLLRELSSRHRPNSLSGHSAPTIILDNEGQNRINEESVFVQNANLLFRQQDFGNLQHQQTQPLLEVQVTTPRLRGDSDITSKRPSQNNSPRIFEGSRVVDQAHTTGSLEHNMHVKIDVETISQKVTMSAPLEKSQRQSHKHFPRKLFDFFGTHTNKATDESGDVANHAPNTMRLALGGIKEEMKVFNRVLQPRLKAIKLYVKVFSLYVFLPTIGVSLLIFHAFGNPRITVGCLAVKDHPDTCPSLSWFLNFLLIRQFIAYSLARATEILVIDFVALKTNIFLLVLGPIPTLMFVQSKGWPFHMSSWAFYSMILNSGANKFARHWLFYQHGLRLFNDYNPAGDIPNSRLNYRILQVAFVVGGVIGVKRFLVGLYLGKRTYAIYGNQLAKVIHQMIVIGQVAALGREFEMRLHDPALTTSVISRYRTSGCQPFDWSWQGFDGIGLADDDEKTEDERANSPQQHRRVVSSQAGDNKSTSPNVENAIESKRRNQVTGMLKSSERIKMIQLLEAWEEPEKEPGKLQNISISAILQFRQSLAFMDLSFPFAIAFGLADTREHCIESSQDVYHRLLLEDPLHAEGILDFSTLAVLARADDVFDDDVIDPAKMKDLIRLFRPDRDGRLSMLDFVKSVDTVYKSLRLLRASINNSSQIGRATEVLINVVFYFALLCVILALFEVNPLKFFLSLSSIIIAFAFMIGAASAKYFEGILFILVRQPYDIGDRIAISDPNTNADSQGSPAWFVEKVDLYTTTVRFASTNEVATLANGSLATSRIINAARSPKALVHLKLKFGVDVPYTKVQLFRKTVEAFVKARPREWLSLTGVRASCVEAHLGYIEYVISCQHREGWQTVVPILQSKADLFSYCLEVQKQLGMRYNAPSLPVDLRMAQLDQLACFGQSVVPSGNDNLLQDDEKEDDQVRIGNQINTSTVPDGIQALADLFLIRTDSKLG